VIHSEGTFTDSLSSRFIDPEDGQLDTSDWLLDKRGFLPVPIIVTEPAVGYGGGAAILFFHPSKHDEERRKNDDPLGLPPASPPSSERVRRTARGEPVEDTSAPGRRIASATWEAVDTLRPT
jgi:hypothetical protein